MLDAVFTPKAQAYIDSIEKNLSNLSPRAVADRVTELVRQHEAWRGGCLNMNPAEGQLSLRARAILATDMATRVSEGLPGDKSFPHHRQNAYVDEIEALIIGLVRRLFGARFVEWRPLSTSMANASVFFTTLKPEDVLLVQGMDGGGNYAYQAYGPPGLTGARVVSIPPSGKTFEISVDHVETLSRKFRPRLIVVGGGKVLFPYPLRELRAIADDVGALLMVDAAHLGLLILSGKFQNPLDEGAHVVTVSTQKSMGGPVGGLVLTNSPDIAARVTKLAFPGLLQTRDQNKYASLAITLAELAQYGSELADRMVENAQTLARALANEGFSVLSRDGEHTRTHQLFLELGDDAQMFEWRCQNANILIPDCALTGDEALGRRSGARLGTHELTRLGMGKEEMFEISRLISRAARDTANAPAVAADVEALLKRHSRIAYSFDGAA